MKQKEIKKKKKKEKEKKIGFKMENLVNELKFTLMYE